MEPLITIESVPISIKYSVTQPESVSKVSESNARIAEKNKTINKTKHRSQASAKLANPNPTRVRTDTFVQGGVSSTFNLTYTATPKYDEEGRLSLNIKMDKSDILPIHQFERDIQSIIGKILGGEKDNSYGLNSMDLSAAFTELQNAVPGSGNTGRSFTPPSFEVEILERPKVIIKYVGGPIYIPKSADPNYDDALE